MKKRLESKVSIFKVKITKLILKFAKNILTSSY